MWMYCIPDWAVEAVNRIAAFGALFFLQSAGILALGLVLASLARKRGAIAQSFILKAFFVGILVCPAATLILEEMGIRAFRIPVPQASIGHRPKGVSATTILASGSALPGPHPLIPSPARRGVNSRPELKFPFSLDSSTGPGLHSTPYRLRSRQAGEDAGGAVERRKANTPKFPVSRYPAGSTPMRALLYLMFIFTWGTASFLLLGRLIIDTVRIAYFRRVSFEAAPVYVETCRSLSGMLKVRPPRVLQSPRVTCPFLAGLFHPAIFLPMGKIEKEFSAHEVLLHELVHLARRDTVWNFLNRIVIALFPFQPLLWILSRKIEETGDFVCDDYVLHHQGNRRLYILAW